MLDTAIAGSSHGHKAMFRSPVTWSALVSSTPHLVPQPIPFNLSEISDTETSGKDTDNEAKKIWNIGTISGLIPHLQRRKAK